MGDFPLTPAGMAKVKEELHRLKKVERFKISREIGVARDLGDLSENFEYHAAKDRQGLMEARIRILEDWVSRSNVIDPATLSGDRVVFGAKVELLYLDKDEQRCYTIVGEPEADLNKGRISVQAPVSRALIGKEVGDEVRIPGKGGPQLVEISDVSFGPID
jgi:transcription elongation factor GreA